MPESSVFICGAILMVFSAGAFSQPPSAEVVPAHTAREPAKPAVPSKPSTEPADTVPIFPGSSVTGGQLEVLQGKNLLLEAQVQAARLQKELTTVETARAADNAPVLSTSVTGIPTDMSTTPAAAKKPGRIAVLEVSGRGKNLQATLVFPDGQRSVVQAGSVLPGSTLKVKAISLSSVTLSDDQQLTF